MEQQFYARNYEDLTEFMSSRFPDFPPQQRFPRRNDDDAGGSGSGSGAQQNSPPPDLLGDH